MEQEKKQIAICRNTENDHVWEWLGDMKFRDLTIGNSFIVQDIERARRVIKISPYATKILNEYPNLRELIIKLHLKFGEIKILSKNNEQKNDGNKV